ncbi:bifunctional 4-hydroxy-2-oxoglutarate aldolase/2-dehydro-3-deoxy-phosphogluconate aldolase [Athalassotoga saccharophila]|uniref:bifunctional 4-hydroxy-2-oxoglutarate aldolase/2-dehydro-3-deoxy-phosphogluconate aldolase n=1 Tax=Athalassotoga saccharophila TaxID=1441386 RepID=UPI00137AD583|nr:bifunctional 4-hydroxy-2-oxoglutarate aldolase/2-dehydro-3-deoxy-phosphogluconate aldolase [Athalassotoga saccharophila]
MKIIEIKNKIKGKIIAVIRANTPEMAEEMAETVLKNGIEIVEITFTVNGAVEVIKNLRKNFPDFVIGAGTVTRLDEARSALKAGAQFIVSPCVIEEVGEFCKTENIFCSLGAQTPTEVYKAYLHGGDIVKLFPGELFNPSIIKILHGPFPYIDFMPTGGINKENAKTWLDSGAFALGVGGYLTGGIGMGNLDLLGVRVRELLESVKG